MKIIDNSKNCTLDKLAIGDVFAINDGIGCYMRIANHTDSNDRIVNVINLEYGNSVSFSNDTIVKKIDATLVIGAVPVVENSIVTEKKNETEEESETEKLKKMTLAEIAEHCHNRIDMSCEGCPLYPKCYYNDIPLTFDNLYILFNE